MEQKKRFEIWNVFTLIFVILFLIFLMWPIANLFKGAFTTPDGEFTLMWFQKFFKDNYYLITLWNSFKVTAWVTILTLIFGYPMAYFYNMYEIKGKKFIQIIIILCAMSPPFIGAYAWIQLLGRNGIITTFLRNKIGFTSMPSIYGFNGILLVLTLQLIPLVFLYISGALKKIDNSLLEAAENMGVNNFQRFFKVIIPLTMPTILASSLLIFMRAFSDFGTPLLIGEGYRVFPVEIYRQFLGETGRNYHFAASIGIIAIIITSAIFLFQKVLTVRFSFTMKSMNTIERKEVSPLKSFLMHAYIYIILFVAFLPQLLTVYQSFQNTSGKIFVKGFSLNSYRVALQRMGQAIPNTLIIGGIALIITVVLAIILAYLVVRRPSFTNNLIDTLSMIPYIIPGSVIGIALVMSFSKKPLILTGTITIMVVSLVLRRMPYTIRSSVAVLQQIPIEIEEASLSLGASKMKTFFTITVPMMASGIISGAILSWVNIITELSGSIILYNASTITLTLAIYTFVLRGNFGYAAALATILSTLTALSLLLYMKVADTEELTL